MNEKDERLITPSILFAFAAVMLLGAGCFSVSCATRSALDPVGFVTMKFPDGTGIATDVTRDLLEPKWHSWVSISGRRGKHKTVTIERCEIVTSDGQRRTLSKLEGRVFEVDKEMAFFEDRLAGGEARSEKFSYRRGSGSWIDIELTVKCRYLDGSSATYSDTVRFR